MDDVPSGFTEHLPESERLEGWKQIAGYLKCGKRTAQRWEKQGLPVHRHDTVGAVYAYTSELDAWRKNHQDEKRPAEGIQLDAIPESSAAAGTEGTQKKLRVSLVIILGLIGLAAAGTVIVRSFRNSEESSQQLRQRSLAVLGFRNLTGRPEASWLSTALSEMFRTELASGEKLKTVSGEDIARMKRELSLTDADSLSIDTLNRIRKNLGPDLVLLGSYVSLGKETTGQIRLNVVLQDTRTGKSIAFPETGTETTLFELVSHAGTILRGKLGIGDLSTSEALNLRTTLPRSLEAQRIYSEGLEKLRLFEAVAARELLQRALEAEPNYAQGHSALADAWSALGYEVKAKEEAKLAFDHSGSLEPEEALSIEAKYRELSKEWDRAIGIYQKLRQFSPHNLEYGLRAARAQTSAGKGKEALGTLVELQRLSADPRIDLAEAVTAESLSDFKREKAVAAKAAAKGDAQGAGLLAARAQLRECWALYNLGQPKSAIERAETARRTFAALKDPSGEAQALKNLADIVDDEGDHVRAQRLYESALAIFRQIEQQTGVAVTLNNLAYALKSQGNLSGAKKMFEESLAVSREIADKAREALALNGIGIILWRQGELSGARRVFDEALVIHRERGDKSRAATVLNNIALLFEDEGSLAEAKPRLEESLKMLREIGDQSAVARTVGNIGELLLKQGDLAGAKAKFAEQLSIGQAIPEDRQRAYALYGLGNTLLAQGDLKAARANHEQALALRMKMGEKGTAAESRLALATLMLEEANLPAADAADREAILEFRKEEELDQEGAANAVLAIILLAQGRLGDAQEMIRTAKDRAEKTQDRFVRLFIMITAARVRAAAGQKSEALKNLQSALSQATKHGYGGYELECRLALAEVEAQSGATAQIRAYLVAVEKEATAKGFGLIARKAASTRLKGEPPRSSASR